MSDILADSEPPGAKLFWHTLYPNVSEDVFLDSTWQSQNAITRIDKLRGLLGERVEEAFHLDLAAGLTAAPMSVRVSPYILALIDWSNPYGDPLRRQFLPLASEQVPDHPLVGLDSLHEQHDSPVPGLVHRYPDKVLFLALDMCPVYCRFCTRSYSVGTDTEGVAKLHLRAKPERWQQAFAYLAAHPEVADVVVSGGDVFNLRADQLQVIGSELLSLPNIKRIRLATKALSVQPCKFLTDHEWTNTIIDLAKRGRSVGKEIAIHTHISHPNELTWITKQAMDRLFSESVTVRNQCVLLRGVNDSVDILRQLITQLSDAHIQPYYVYQHDLVPGVEDLRTPLKVTLELEKHIRGTTAGFNTPAFVVDAPGGGGKRDVHSYEYYNVDTGVSVYRSPAINPNGYYMYVDPLDTLSDMGRLRWHTEPDVVVAEALNAAGAPSKAPPKHKLRVVG